LSKVYAWGIYPLSDTVVGILGDTANYIEWQDTTAYILTYYDTNTYIVTHTLFNDSIENCIKVRDSLTAYATPDQVHDSVYDYYGAAYKTAERTITTDGTGTDWHTLISSTAGEFQEIVFNDSTFEINKTGIYLIIYDVSVQSDQVDTITTRIIINTTAKDEGKQEMGTITELRSIKRNMSGHAILSLNSGEKVKIQITSTVAATLKHSYFQFSVIKL